MAAGPLLPIPVGLLLCVIRAARGFSFTHLGMASSASSSPLAGQSDWRGGPPTLSEVTRALENVNTSLDKVSNLIDTANSTAYGMVGDFLESLAAFQEVFTSVSSAAAAASALPGAEDVTGKADKFLRLANSSLQKAQTRVPATLDSATNQLGKIMPQLYVTAEKLSDEVLDALTTIQESLYNMTSADQALVGESDAGNLAHKHAASIDDAPQAPSETDASGDRRDAAETGVVHQAASVAKTVKKRKAGKNIGKHAAAKVAAHHTAGEHNASHESLAQAGAVATSSKHVAAQIGVHHAAADANASEDNVLEESQSGDIIDQHEASKGAHPVAPMANASEGGFFKSPHPGKKMGKHASGKGGAHHAAGWDSALQHLLARTSKPGSSSSKHGAPEDDLVEKVISANISDHVVAKEGAHDATANGNTSEESLLQAGDAEEHVENRVAVSDATHVNATEKNVSEGAVVKQRKPGKKIGKRSSAKAGAHRAANASRELVIENVKSGENISMQDGAKSGAQRETDGAEATAKALPTGKNVSMRAAGKGGAHHPAARKNASGNAFVQEPVEQKQAVEKKRPKHRAAKGAGKGAARKSLRAKADATSLLQERVFKGNDAMRGSSVEDSAALKAPSNPCNLAKNKIKKANNTLDFLSSVIVDANSTVSSLTFSVAASAVSAIDLINGTVSPALAGLPSALVRPVNQKMEILFAINESLTTDLQSHVSDYQQKVANALTMLDNVGPLMDTLQSAVTRACLQGACGDAAQRVCVAEQL